PSSRRPAAPTSPAPPSPWTAARTPGDWAPNRLRSNRNRLGPPRPQGRPRTERGGPMYGTCARTRVKPENRQKLREVISGQDYTGVPGYVHSFVLHENDSDVSWLF